MDLIGMAIFFVVLFFVIAGAIRYANRPSRSGRPRPFIPKAFDQPSQSPAWPDIHEDDKA